MLTDTAIVESDLDEMRPVTLNMDIDEVEIHAEYEFGPLTEDQAV